MFFTEQLYCILGCLFWNKSCQGYLFIFQLQRKPKPFPKLKILRTVEDINDFKAEDFQLEGYDPHPTIRMEMAV